MIKNRFQKKRKYPLIIGCLILPTVCFVIFTVLVNFTPWYNAYTGSIGGIYPQDIYLTTIIDNQGMPINPSTTFRAETSQIYCIVTSTGQFGAPWGATIIVRWYYESEEIATNVFDIVAGRPAVASLYPPTNKPFRQGNYSVQVFIKNHLVEIIDFEVQ